MPDTLSFDRRRNAHAVSRDTLIRDTHALLAAAGIERSPAWVSTLIGKYRRSPMAGLPFGQYLAARLEMSAQQRSALAASSDLRYVLEYRDPTGETAVRRVMAARS